MTLSEHVRVKTSLIAGGIVQPGFGKVLILGGSDRFVEDRRRYTSAAAMLEDGFLSTDPEYISALAVFSQNPTIADVMVGFKAAGVAQVTNIDITGNDDGDYSITLDAFGVEGGVTYTYAASSDTAADIRTALVGLINAGSQAVTAAPGAGDSLDLTSDVAGTPHLASVANLNGNMALSVTTPNVGIPEDLVRISDVDDDWYMLLMTTRTDADIMVAAKTIEAMPKIFFAQSSDTDIKDSAYDAGATPTEVGSALKKQNLNRTALWWHGTDTDALDAAIAGRGLSENPGSITWKFKDLSGVASTEFTATERSNLRGDPQGDGQGKCVNIYTPVQGDNWTMEGTMASGEWIDVMRGLDWVNARIEVEVGNLKSSTKKIPFTDRGIGLIVGVVQTVLNEAIAADVLAEDPQPSITAPRAADVPAGQRGKRYLNGLYCVKWEGQLAGAVHATEVCGEVTA